VRRSKRIMEGAVQTLASSFGVLVGEELQKLRGVGGEVAQLRDELATMNALIRMQSEAEPAAVDHFLREWMKQLREVAYDAEDCVHLYTFRVRCRPGDDFLVWSKRLLATLLPRRRLAGDIKALRARAAAINEQHSRYGLSLEPLRRPPPPSAHVPTALRPAANDPNQLVGIRGQANALAKMVMVTGKKDEEPGSDMRLKVFSVVGFGGLGKTTLALEVCRHLEAEFQHQALVSVSQAFDGAKDLKGLLKRVLQQMVNPAMDVGQGINEENDQDKLAAKLKETLKNKRYYQTTVSHYCLFSTRYY
jgi:disease resistance protein RPM1